MSVITARFSTSNQTVSIAGQLVRNGYALAGTTVITTSMGFGYWLLAARLYSPEEVGRGQAAINLIMVLTAVVNLRLMTALIRFLPRRRHPGRLLLQCYGVVTLVAFLAVPLVGLLLVGAPLEGLASTSVMQVALLTLAVWAFAIFTLQDSALVGLGLATWLPIENGLHSGVKLLLILLFASTLPSTGIALSFAVPTLLALGPVNYLIHRHLRRSGEAGAAGLASTATDKGIRRFALTEYVGAVGEIVVVNGMPVIVALAIGVSESAGFSIGWLIVMMLEVVIIQFCSSLTVEGARHPEQLSTLVLVAARRLFPLGLIMTVGVVVIGPFALSIFGSAYRAEGLATLQIAALALVPRVVIQLRLAVARIQTDLRTQLVVPLASMVATLAIALPLIRPIGAAGIAWGYLIASTGLALALIPGFPTIREART